mgnify:CR=1 FL=1
MLNKKKLLLLSFSFLILSTLISCSTWNKFNDTEKGAIIGGGAGAAVGSAVSPGAGGALIGGAVGATGGALIGNERDENKKRRR